MPFAYFPFAVWEEVGVPLHPARKPTTERGYLTSQAPAMVGV